MELRFICHAIPKDHAGPVTRSVDKVKVSEIRLTQGHTKVLRAERGSSPEDT